VNSAYVAVIDVRTDVRVDGVVTLRGKVDDEPPAKPRHSAERRRSSA